MRHCKHRHTLGLKKEHRKATLAHLSAALFRNGRIETTLAKARALRPFAEPLVTKAIKALYATPPKRVQWAREINRKVRDRDAVHLLMAVVAPGIVGRPGGYLRIVKLCMRRIGDASEMALIEFVEYAELLPFLRMNPDRKINNSATATVPEHP